MLLQELYEEAKCLLDILGEAQIQNEELRGRVTQHTLFDAPAKSYLERQILDFIEQFRGRPIAPILEYPFDCYQI